VNGQISNGNYQDPSINNRSSNNNHNSSSNTQGNLSCGGGIDEGVVQR
jgi:hypothetical protein